MIRVTLRPAILPRLAAVVLAGLCLLRPAPAAAAPELLDRIVAVVDDQVVLWSELNLRAQLELQAEGRDPRFLSEADLAAARQRLLKDMVDELVVIKKAQKDSIQVDPERVQEQLDAEFGRIQRSVGEAELTAMLERSGMTERQLKKRYRKEIRHRLLYEQMVSELAYRQFITRRDVEAFRERYTDSLPQQVSISQIVRRVTAADSVLEQARVRIATIEQELAAGSDFAAVARHYSEDPGTASNGGDLGCFRPGTLAPAFERAAYDLKPGETSQAVLTPFGFHVILLHEKRETELCASHILVRARTSPGDRERVRAELEALRQQAMTGGDFAQLARDHSDDTATARQGGLWQILARDQIPPVLQPFLEGLGLGDVTEPFFLQNEGRIMKINDDYATLESLVRQELVESRVEEVIDDYRRQIHVEERLDEDWLWDPAEARAGTGAAAGGPLGP